MVKKYKKGSKVFKKKTWKYPTISNYRCNEGLYILLFVIVETAGAVCRRTDKIVVKWYDADRGVLTIIQFRMAIQIAQENMKTTHAQFVVTMITNALETLKFIAKEESGQGKMGKPPHQTANIYVSTIRIRHFEYCVAE